MRPIEPQRPRAREPKVAYEALARLDELSPDGDVARIMTLPREHPAWCLDLRDMSERADRLVAGLRPAVLRILGFWDHVARSIELRSGRLHIDASGSYRLD